MCCGCPWFQSTPAFSGEGTLSGLAWMGFRSFNPPPPFQARERETAGGQQRLSQFQSTPAFSGEGTQNPGRVCWVHVVSIHPRLFRRGNSSLRGYIIGNKCFNPPPPFQARERYNVKRVSDIPVVSIHPRLFRRGNALRQANDNRKVIRAVARTRLQLNSYAVNTPFPIK